MNALSIDVEDWYHILDTPSAPSIQDWPKLESRVRRNTERLLDMLEENKIRATFFWLGWIAERNTALLRECYRRGHEIASHGYGHVLAIKAGPKGFREDVVRSKVILEDIIGEEVRGFRAAGFGFEDGENWPFDEVQETGYQYDASVSPFSRAHGGNPKSPLQPYLIKTRSGTLLELPMSAVDLFGHRICLFGGGYLRLAPLWLIRWGVKQLEARGRPLLVYVHPREIDPGQPRLSLNLKRRFKYYVNIESTMSKLEWLCKHHSFCTMGELADASLKLFKAGSQSYSPGVQDITEKEELCEVSRMMD